MTEFPLRLIKAQQDGYLQAYILLPTLIHGTGTGPGKKASVAFRMFAGDAIAKKKAYYIGDGSNNAAAVRSLSYSLSLVLIPSLPSGPRRRSCGLVCYCIWEARLRRSQGAVLEPIRTLYYSQL